jgi:hypothetical protein
MKLEIERQDIPHARRKDAIIAICEKYIKPHNIFQNMKRRHRPDVQMRQLVMYVLKEFTYLPYLDIGTVFKKDHATAVHACRQMEIFLKDEKFFDPKLRSLYIQIRRDVLAIIGDIDDIDELEETLEEELLRVKGLNYKLIQREIHRRERMIFFKSQLQYVPDRYSKRIIKFIEECIAPL